MLEDNVIFLFLSFKALPFGTLCTHVVCFDLLLFFPSYIKLLWPIRERERERGPILEDAFTQCKVV